MSSSFSRAWTVKKALNPASCSFTCISRLVPYGICLPSRLSRVEIPPGAPFQCQGRSLVECHSVRKDSHAGSETNAGRHARFRDCTMGVKVLIFHPFNANVVHQQYTNLPGWIKWGQHPSFAPFHLGLMVRPNRFKVIILYNCK